MEIQPAAPAQTSAVQQKIDDNREVREAERKAAEDSEVERQEVESTETEHSNTEPGVGENVDIEA